jgi:hypothetical protein
MYWPSFKMYQENLTTRNMIDQKEGSAISLIVLAMLLVAAMIMSVLLGRRSDN